MNLQTKANPEYAKCFPYLLKLLAYVLDSEKSLPDCTDVNWQALYSLSEFHSLAGMVSYAVCALPKAQRPQGEIFDMFRQHQGLALVTESNVAVETEKLLSALSDAGVRTLPVKGYVLKNDYPIPAMRSMTDVDIIYDSDKKQEVKDVLASFGYALEETGDELDFTKEPFYHYELHADKKTKHTFTDTLLSRARFTENSFTGVLNREDFYIFLIYHLARHFSAGGAGVRMVLDVYVYCRRYYESFDKDYLHRELDSLNLLAFESKIRKLSYDWFGGETPRTDDLLSDFILCSCTFGNTRDALLSSAIVAESKSGKKQSAFKSILRRIFIPYSSIAELYPSANKHKILYPFSLFAYWWKRVFKTRNINTNNLKYYSISTDSEEAIRHKAVMKEAGLSYDWKES